MENKESSLGSPSSVYQTNLPAAYFALLKPMLPLYIVAGIIAAVFYSSWIFWVISVPLLGIATLSFYRFFDCSRSKKVELYSQNKTLIVFGFSYPLGFFDIFQKKKVVLRYLDICAIEVSTYKGSKYYTVFTHDSKFRFMEHFDESNELYTALAAMSAFNNHPPSESERSHASVERAKWISVSVEIILATIYAIYVIYF